VARVFLFNSVVCLTFVLFTATIPVYSGVYETPPFSNGGRSIPQPSDEVIAPLSGESNLREISFFVRIALWIKCRGMM
jgi:hypothetical protein